MDSTETYISLYAGGGGLDMGFQRAHGNAQCIAVVEHEASAVGLLVDHIEAGLLDAAPVFTDAYTFPAERFHGLVDWVIGGPPCQPFSVAGKQLGADDPRNLWPLTLRMVGQIQPGGCFFENVPSAESLWYIYEEVIPGLQHLGYEVACGIFSAAEVGAPHNRERVFILAVANSERERRVGHQEQRLPEVESGSRELADTGCEQQHVQQRGARAEPAGVGGNVAYTGSQQRHGGRDTEEERVHPAIGQTACGDEQWADRLHRAGEGGGNVGDTDGIGRRAQDHGEREAGGASRNGRPFRWPPGPGSTEAWRQVIETRADLAPALEPSFRDMADGLAGRVAALSRAQELRILGNGVVPATAEKAFRTLEEQA